MKLFKAQKNKPKVPCSEVPQKVAFHIFSTGLLRIAVACSQGRQLVVCPHAH